MKVFLGIIVGYWVVVGITEKSRNKAIHDALAAVSKTISE